MKKLLHCLVISLILAFPKNSLSQIIFSESFSTATLPPGWTNDSAGSPTTNLWLFDNPYMRVITGAGFDGSFAIFDSDEGTVNDSIDENTSLTTLPVDISDVHDSLFLELDQQYRMINGVDGSWRIISVSINGGSSWVNVDSSQDDLGYPNPAVHSRYDLTDVLPANSLLVRFTYTGSWDWWWAIDNVSLVSVSPCNAPPEAGSTVASVSSACPGDSFLLSLSGADIASGLSYQWQSSSDGLSWFDLLDDTLSTLLRSHSVATYYRVNMTCSGQIATSAPVLVGLSGMGDCFCVGEFGSGCDILNKVEFNTLLNDSSGCNGLVNNYIYYLPSGSMTTTVEADSSYDLTIASGDGSGFHGAGAWFDWNHNGSFQDSGEFFHISDSIPENSGDFTITIQVPATAAGLTRMRVRYIYDDTVSVTSDCSFQSFGETEDYSIYVTNGTTGVKDAVAADYIIYPLPAHDHLVIKRPAAGSATFRITDLSGRLCLTGRLTSESYQMVIGHLTAGVYLIHIFSEWKNVVKKIGVN